jgi:hypothetical protein
MAACPTCSREMLAAPGCRPRLGAIRYGSERHVQDAWPERCPDCACLDGGTHHPYCDVEECGSCGGQWISCVCGPLAGPARRLLRVLQGGR